MHSPQTNDVPATHIAGIVRQQLNKLRYIKPSSGIFNTLPHALQ